MDIGSFLQLTDFSVVSLIKRRPLIKVIVFHQGHLVKTERGGEVIKTNT